MGWQTEQFGTDHEGFPVAVMGDGTEPAPINGNSAWWLYDGQDGRPRAIAVRAACECGWRSPEMFPIDFEDRSEEHTSELQSRENLVCRLLLEKKKTIIINFMPQ